VIVKIEYNNEIITALLLASFIMTTLKDKEEEVSLIFIPWKHKIKELAIIRNYQIIEKDDDKLDSFINIDSFTSEFKEELPYYTSYLIKNYYGYDFIYYHKGFIANVYQHCFETPLNILYQELPELLKETNNEE
jgi:hypothetical protein